MKKKVLFGLVCVALVAVFSSCVSTPVDFSTITQPVQIAQMAYNPPPYLYTNEYGPGKLFKGPMEFMDYGEALIGFSMVLERDLVSINETLKAKAGIELDMERFYVDLRQSFTSNPEQGRIYGVYILESYVGDNVSWKAPLVDDVYATINFVIVDTPPELADRTLTGNRTLMASNVVIYKKDRETGEEFLSVIDLLE